MALPLIQNDGTLEYDSPNPTIQSAMFESIMDAFGQLIQIGNAMSHTLSSIAVSISSIDHSLNDVFDMINDRAVHEERITAEESVSDDGDEQKSLFKKLTQSFSEGFDNIKKSLKESIGSFFKDNKGSIFGIIFGLMLIFAKELSPIFIGIHDAIVDIAEIIEKIYNKFMGIEEPYEQGLIGQSQAVFGKDGRNAQVDQNKVLGLLGNIQNKDEFDALNEYWQSKGQDFGDMLKSAGWGDFKSPTDSGATAEDIRFKNDIVRLVGIDAYNSIIEGKSYEQTMPAPASAITSVRSSDPETTKAIDLRNNKLMALRDEYNQYIIEKSGDPDFNPDEGKSLRTLFDFMKKRSGQEESTWDFFKDQLGIEDSMQSQYDELGKMLGMTGNDLRNWLIDPNNPDVPPPSNVRGMMEINGLNVVPKGETIIRIEKDARMLQAESIAEQSALSSQNGGNQTVIVNNTKGGDTVIGGNGGSRSVGSVTNPNFSGNAPDAYQSINK